MSVAEEDLRARIVSAARGWIGTPYRHQASLRGVGCDCLGLVRGVWREVIGPEPEVSSAYSPSWAEAGAEDLLLAAASRHLVPRDVIAPGDVLVFRYREGLVAKHCGIAVTHDRFVHAQDGAVVCDVALTDWWRRRVAGVFGMVGVGLADFPSPCPSPRQRVEGTLRIMTLSSHKAAAIAASSPRRRWGED